MKIQLAAAAASMGALAVLLAPTASADFDRAGYLRCMVSDSMSVGGLTIDSSSAAKIGAEAYAALGGGASKSAQQEEAASLAKKHGISESVATLIVKCASSPST